MPLLLRVAYLPQEALSELQVLQPLLVHGVDLGELGCQKSFLQNKEVLSRGGGTRDAWSRLAA